MVKKDMGSKKVNAAIKQASVKMSEKNTSTTKKGKSPKSMRSANIRVTYVNHTKDGVVEYSYQDLQALLTEWANERVIRYALNDHGDHCHIVIDFMKAPAQFELIKKKFPYGYIKPTETMRGAIRYLIHADDQKKRENDPKEYTLEDIVTNDRKWVEKFFDTDKKKIEELIDENLVINSYIREGRDLVDRGIITIKQYMKYKRYIETRLKFLYENVILPALKNRNINVIMVCSEDGGTGKTAFLKEFFKIQGCSVLVASDRDPMQQYNGEDVLILDDARDETFKYREMLKLIDQFTGSPVGSRNVNRLFMGHTIVIITNQLLDDWYSYEISHKHQKGCENGTSFYRRIQQFWDFGLKDSFSVYEYKKLPNYSATCAMDYFELVKTIKNPITDEWKTVNEPIGKVGLLDPELASKLVEISTSLKMHEKKLLDDIFKNAENETEIDYDGELSKRYKHVDEVIQSYAQMLLEEQKNGAESYPALQYQGVRVFITYYNEDKCACDGNGNLLQNPFFFL